MPRLKLELKADEVGQYRIDWRFRGGESTKLGLDPAFQVDHKGHDDVFLGLKVVVDCSLADIDGLRNLVHGHVRDSVLGKQLDPRSNDTCADSSFLTFASRLG
jgi:hypothetical protein